MKLHKIILVLISLTLMIIFDVLVNAVPQVPQDPPKQKEPSSEPPKQTPTGLPFPPKQSSSKLPSSTKQQQTSSAPEQKTSDLPKPTPQPTESVNEPTQVIVTESANSAPLPTATSTPKPLLDTTCSISQDCPKAKFCDLSVGKCQRKGKLDDQCNNDDDECLDGFICHKNFCKKKNNNSNIKKAAIACVIIVGVSGVFGLIFFMCSSQRRKDDKQDFTTSTYSTEEMTNSNSFSNNTMQPPRGIPITNHFENLPPIGNRGFEESRPGFYNYYNEVENIRQQPSPLQQHYNWNHGVPAPAKQFLPMNQGGLFPIRTIRENYGVFPSNIKKNFHDNNPLRDPNVLPTSNFEHTEI
ncbi:15170_t:CDS:2 [Funneliformis geosporum]|nr:15170_t:CDS:2 [Funneliformis geosporum]